MRTFGQAMPVSAVPLLTALLQRHPVVLAPSSYRQLWQATDVSAELAKRVICTCIFEICFFRDFMWLKRQKFSWTTCLLTSNRKASLFFSCYQERNKKRTTSSPDRSSISSSIQAAAFAVPLCKDKQCEKFRVM